ncbi:hypothetical protein Q3G72_034297 [Acer saccharum]|nr:hypothetical protein Q3G72_034297 [Acer saccharum]
MGHHMLTRSKNNIHKPINKLSLVSVVSPPQTEPTCVSQAMKTPEWRRAMSDEFDALIKNGTWSLVPPSPSHNIVGCKWVFRIKRSPNGSIARYKAHLVAKGFHQRQGLDYNETFSPVVKTTTIRVLLNIAVTRGWSLRQLDVNNAFLQGYLTENVVMAQPPGFVDPSSPLHVCQLKKAIYGLKQAPRAWYNELRQFLVQNGNGDLVDKFIKLLAQRFSIKDLGVLSYFLGVEVIGALQYLSFTRPDIAFAVNKLTQFMHRPTTGHWSLAKRLLCYLRGTAGHGLLVCRNSPLSLHAFSDADWADPPLKLNTGQLQLLPQRYSGLRLSYRKCTSPSPFRQPSSVTTLVPHTCALILSSIHE